MEFEELPLDTQAAATKALREAQKSPYRCGDTGVAVGYWVESHTLGCRNVAGDPDLWEGHWELWDQYSKDGKSILIGDPADGVFVSITPLKDRSASMGAEMLIELGRRVKQTIPLEEAEAIAENIAYKISPFTDPILIAGSIRRRRPQIGDVEFVVLPKHKEAFFQRLEELGFEGGERIQKKMEQGVPIEIYIAKSPEELGAMLLMYTGDYVSNIALRSIAKRRGWKLDQYGIWDAKTGKPLLQSPDEREFYDFLGVDWHNPEERSFKDRPKRKKKAAQMGAEMLIELGESKRQVGYINLKLLSPDEDRTENWVLQVERMDPHGGDPWNGEFRFKEQSKASYWYNSIVSDDDLDQLVSQMKHVE